MSDYEFQVRLKKGDACDGCIVVEADSEQEARTKAQKYLRRGEVLAELLFSNMGKGEEA